MTLAQSADEGKRMVQRMLALHKKLAAATMPADKALVQARHQQCRDDIVVSPAEYHTVFTLCGALMDVTAQWLGT